LNQIFNDFETHKNGTEFWQREFVRLDTKKKSLLDLITEGKILEDDFEEKKNEIECEQSNVKDNLDETEKTGNL